VKILNRHQKVGGKVENHPKKPKYGQSTALQTQYPLFTIGKYSGISLTGISRDHENIS